ncbi:MAG: hypothetical protein GY849_02120 [Deltaproteobacteria bacterium]|nr:hypothetical protein [Deltaproteobacteria bacterium]
MDKAELRKLQLSKFFTREQIDRARLNHEIEDLQEENDNLKLALKNLLIKLEQRPLTKQDIKDVEIWAENMNKSINWK